MKFVSNLLLIFIICYSISAIPINTSIIELPHEFINVFSTNSKEKPEKQVSYNYNTNLENNSATNPTNIDFIMIGEFDKGSYVLTEDHQIILEVLKDNNPIKTYYDNEIVTSLKEVSNEDSQLSYTLDISQENLELNPGKYDFKIYSSLETFNKVDPYVFSVQYGSTNVDRDIKYIPAIHEVENGFMYITLYFPDKGSNYLVPISRKVPYSDRIIRTTIENLRKGPKDELGLSEGSPIPDVPRVWVEQGTAALHLPSDLGIYEQGSTISQLAVDSLVNSLTSIYGVERIRFLENGKYVDVMFHGIDVSKPIEKNNYPNIYLALATENERYLLVPIGTYESNDNIGDMASIMFQSLKTGDVNNYSYDSLHPPIPNSVELINADFSHGILTLNVSNDFIDCYGDRSDLKHMMLDSILYSFNSIPKVNKVSITVNGNEITNFVDINISEPMPAPEYVNIENPNE